MTDATPALQSHTDPEPDEDEPGGPARPTPDFTPETPEPEPEPDEDEPGGPARPTPDFTPETGARQS